MMANALVRCGYFALAATARRSVLLLGLLVACSYAAPAGAQAIISNGGIALGVDSLGQLNVPDGTGGVFLTPTNSGSVGLYSFALDADATSPGCLCEGFGISANGVSGFADNAAGTAGLTSVSFGSTASTATAVAELSSLTGFTVTQFYHPSASPDLFIDEVTLTYGTGSAVSDLRYNRTMDWDIPPTTFDEFVTLQGWPATALLNSGDDGFQSPDPLVASDIFCGGVANANFTDAGPCDHGARFTFGFGGLAAGGTKSFSIFYGASLSEAAALTALGTVGAEVYSLGQCHTGVVIGCDATVGTPSTFIFGFAGVGGTALPPPDPPVSSAVPEPSSLILMGSGLLAAVRYRRRQSSK
ncbi:MAG: hypothetical protein DMF94_05705 [Acidobacteria bacterium]|nr:MAG: hypothetical protein DMF94_05705 [Acidobacteriota bacterium]